MNLRAIAAILWLAAYPVFAGDLDGKWTGTIQTAAGPVQVDYVLKASGTMLTGTAPGPDGESIPLRNGKIDGDKISFSLDISLGGDPATTYTYTGVVSGNEIQVHTEYAGRSVDFILKKIG